MPVATALVGSPRATVGGRLNEQIADILVWVFFGLAKLTLKGPCIVSIERPIAERSRERSENDRRVLKSLKHERAEPIEDASGDRLVRMVHGKKIVNLGHDG
jgi:hypothetical protein